MTATHPQSPASPLPEAAEPVAWSAREDPQCRDGGEACIDCLCRGECIAAAPSPVAQAPAQAGEAWTRAMNAALTYRNADPEAIDEQDAWANLVDALGALATQPLAAPESIGWAAFDTRENRMRTRCETLEQIEAYIQQQHQSRDDITLYKRPIFAGDRS